MLEVIFLGTSGSMPTEGRNLPAIAVRHEGRVLLFDAGEDVQRQLGKAAIGLNKRMAIFITHVHADHIIGLPGLLLRFSLLGRIRPLNIYGPKGIIEYVQMNQKTINLGTTFEAKVYEIEPGVIFSKEDLSVRAFEVDHRGYAMGYKLVYQKPTGTFLPQKATEFGVPKGPMWGKLAAGESVILENGTKIRPEDVTSPVPAAQKIVYSGDTRPCTSLKKAAENADILIYEAMYTNEHSDLAKERGHTTAEEAAQLALDAGVKHLVLTHYSPRYENGTPIIKEAQEIFPNAILAKDLMRIKLDRNGSIEVIEPE